MLLNIPYDTCSIFHVTHLYMPYDTYAHGDMNIEIDNNGKMAEPSRHRGSPPCIRTRTSLIST